MINQGSGNTMSEKNLQTYGSSGARPNTSGLHSGLGSANNSGQNSGLMAAKSTLRKGQPSPKGAEVARKQASLKYALNTNSQLQMQVQQQQQQQNFMDKYQLKTRNKVGQISGQPQIGNSDSGVSASSGNGGQPNLYALPRKLHSSGQIMTPYKGQTATSHSPKVSAQPAGKLLFSASQSQHQFNQAQLASAGMQNFEDAQQKPTMSGMMASHRQMNYAAHQAQAHVRNGQPGPGTQQPPDREEARTRQMMTGTGLSQSKSNIGVGVAHATHAAMSSEYYSRNARKAGGSKHASPETSSQAVHSSQTLQKSSSRSKSKTGQTAAQFVQRRGSGDKKETPLKGPGVVTQRNAIYFQEYLEHNKARSPKVLASKQLESLRSEQAAQAQMGSNGMFQARATQQLRVSTKQQQYQYANVAPRSPMEPGLAKSRNCQVQAATSQGSLQAKYGAGKPLAFTSSPKAHPALSRDNAGSKMKAGLKSSSKHASPATTMRDGTGMPKPGLFGDSRNPQAATLRSKDSMGASRSGGMNYNRANQSPPGLAPTAQYKKVLQKGPVPLLGGKVLDDNDEEEEDYEDEEFDEQSPTTGTSYQRRVAEHAAYANALQAQKDKAKKGMSQTDLLAKQQRRHQKELLRNIWIASEKGDYRACHEILVSQDRKLAQALLNECNSDGWTPLHVASNEGHVDLIEIFAQYGSNLDCRAKTMRTPLHVACIRGNYHVINALLSKGADVNAQDGDGNTPCHFCSEYGHTDCLQLLLLKHPQLVTKNKDNVSPLDVAVNKEILQKFTDYINSVKNILRSQRGSSKNSRSSQTSGNGSTNVGGNIAEGNSAKVPISVSKPANRQTSAANLNIRRSPRGLRQPEMGASPLKTEEELQKRAAEEAQVRAAERATAQQNAAIEQKLTGNAAARIIHKHVQIHDSLAKKGERASHRKTRSHGGFEEDKSNSVASSAEDETVRRVGPDDFMPLKLLGSGSFGEVYLVREIRNGDLFAMKVLTKHKIFGNNLVRYAKTERDVLSYTKHPFIVSLNYAFQTETKLFLILDFCPGGDLGRILQREGRFSEDRARKYLCEVLLALEDLHKRDIIYRDLKPDNVVLDNDGHAQLTDFGLSKEGVLDGNKGAKSFCGSVAYLAPEMIRKAGHGKSVDWYLLGVLLYEMIVGQPPYFSDSKSELFHNIQRGVLKLPVSMSVEAKNLIVHLLNRNPSKRLGAGEQGANEIKKHPFFAKIDWPSVEKRVLTVQKPQMTYQWFKNKFENFNCTDEQKGQIFEDVQVTDDKRTDRVEGWSFVNHATDQNIDAQRQQHQQLMGNEDQVAGKSKSSAFAKKRGSGSQTVVYATNASKEEEKE